VDEAELARDLTAACNGNEAAFARIWRYLQPAVLRYLGVLVGDAAEDVASETWLQVARELRGFRGGAPVFRVWVFRIARNRGIDELRRRDRRPEQPHALETLTELEFAPDAGVQALSTMDTQWALAMIASLPADQAEAVTLRVVAGLDVAQTAQVLGKRPGAVRIAAMRGLRRLAQRVEVQERRAELGPRSRPVRAPSDSLRPDGLRPDGMGV
jgi:RNA polymerase sigma-70 factor (ECF subfamily)